MTFVYNGGPDHGPHVWGTYIFNTFVIAESHGLAMVAASPEMAPFTVKGNAVLFDKNETWQPTILNDANKPLDFNRNCLYYSTGDSNNPGFECIDVVARKIIK